jgi:hypothetical protein
MIERVIEYKDAIFTLVIVGPMAYYVGDKLSDWFKVRDLGVASRNKLIKIFANPASSDEELKVSIEKKLEE